MNGCVRIGRWLGGCNFEARYDHGKPDLSEIPQAARVYMTSRERDVFRERTYVKDVCTRCGKTIKREERA